jgi:hypothetical protein
MKVKIEFFVSLIIKTSLLFATSLLMYGMYILVMDLVNNG